MPTSLSQPEAGVTVHMPAGTEQLGPGANRGSHSVGRSSGQARAHRPGDSESELELGTLLGPSMPPLRQPGTTTLY
jgi:hypothetical protein